MLDSVSMFFTSGDESGCGLYRTKYPAEMLNKEWHFGFPTKDERINTSQVIQMQRATHEYFLKWIPMAQARGQKIIYDIDDNLFEIPSYNPAYRPYKSALLKTVKDIIGLCDAVTVSTEPLKQYFLQKKIHHNVTVIPNFLHHLPEYKEVDNGDIFRIGYHGTITHSGDFDSKLIFALNDVLKQYPHVQLTCMGYNPLKIKEHPQVTFVPFVDVTEFHDKLSSLDFDIGIAPLYDNAFNQSKSNIKILEYAYCSIPTIAQNVYPYKNTIDHGNNGLLIDNNKEWKNALCNLIENKQYRRELARNIYDKVDANFTYKNNGNLIDELYTKVLESIL